MPLTLKKDIMEKNKLFQNHIQKLKLEAIVKSALSGVAVGLGANFLTSLVTWFTPFHGFWLSLVVFATVSAVAGALFYYKRFYPSDMNNARRLDSMGLHERLITMVEFQNDDSPIARMQREDARRTLASVDNRQIKLKISKAILVTFLVTFLLAGSMTTVNAMSEQGIVPRGDELVGSIVDDVTTVSYLITYEVKDGGVLYGTGKNQQYVKEVNQLVEKGSSSTPIVALANDGYYFVMWSDGNTSAARGEDNVGADATYTAIFKKLTAEDEWQDYDEGDGPEDAPEIKTQGQGPGDSANGESPDDSMLGGGKYEPNNQVINGSIYYRDVITAYKDTADERILGEGSTLTEAEIEFIKKYLGIV